MPSTDTPHSDRHMIRHKEKDDEAGGEGLGILATRKRLWRDANGNIVNARRPSYTQEGAKRRQMDRGDGRTSRLLLGPKQTMPTNQYSLSLRHSPVFSEAEKGSGCSPIPINIGVARYTEKLGQLSHGLVIDPALGTPLPSPPLSESSMFSVRPTPSPSEIQELDGIYEETWAVNERYPEVHPAMQDRESLEYMNNPSWSNQLFQSTIVPAPIPQYHMMKQEPHIYGWQPYGPVMSRCREEKFEATEMKRPEWSPIYAGSETSYHRVYGVGNC
ncbi:hypothetical protein B7494_g5110 [Chlorociboria aeruginascens]|nr:hypothetical protein B7494_g5110 [Chlorociboria aeruginascens]